MLWVSWHTHTATATATVTATAAAPPAAAAAAGECGRSRCSHGKQQVDHN
jgi:hypothetical protein